MKFKKILKVIGCLTLTLTMLVPSSLSTLAATIETDAVFDEGGEWISVEDGISEINDVDYVAENQILSGVIYVDGKFTVNLHPYIEGYYDEDNNSAAVGEVTVNLYSDCDENWANSIDKEPFVDLLATGSVSDISFENNDVDVEIEISDIPESFVLEAVYTLSDGENVLIHETVSDFSYTNDVTETSEASIAGICSEEGINPDLVVNLSSESDTESTDYLVLREDSAVVNNEGTYEIRATEEEDTYVLMGVPEEILSNYPTNEELSRIPQLVLVGYFGEDDSAFYASPDGEKTPLPLKATHYRALNDDPKSTFDYEYKYAIEYIYTEDVENENLSEVSSDSFESAEEILSSEISEYLGSTTEEVLSEETSNDAEETTAAQSSDYTNTSGEPCGIKFTVNSDAELIDVFEKISVDNFEASGLGDIYKETINKNGISGTISTTPTLKIDGNFNIKKKKINLTLDFGLKSSYDFNCSGTGTITDYKKEFPAISVGYLFLNGSLGTNFSINKISGKGEISGKYEGTVHIGIGWGTENFSKKFESSLSKYYADSDTTPLICNTEMGVELGLNGGISTGLVAQAHIGFNMNWGANISGLKDTEVVAGINHLCNTDGNKLGCTHGTITDFYKGKLNFYVELGVGIGSFKKTKKILNRSPELFNCQDSSCRFYSSKQYSETKKGDCPYKKQIDFDSVAITANPEPGVFLYDENGLNVALTADQAGCDIYYAVENSDSATEEELQYSKYNGNVNVKFDFEDGREMSTRTIYAYAKIGGTQYETYQFQYIMLKDGIKCLMVPEQLTIPAGGEETVVFIYPSTANGKETSAEVVAGSGDDKISIIKQSTGMSGYYACTVKGVSQGSAEAVGYVTIYSGNNSAKYSAKCDITVTDDIAKPTAQYGTNLYLLRNISKDGFGSYKDKNTEDEANAPYFYHNDKHSIGEVLSHSSWKQGEGSTESSIKIYYTTDGSTPSTDNGIEFKAGDKVYLSPESESALSIITLKAIAYDTKSGKKSEVASWTYVIGDKPDLSKARVIMIPTEKHLKKYGVGLCVAIYVPKLTDLIDPECWIDIKSKDKDGVETVKPCFKVVWKWRSSGWLTVPVLGTNEWITEPTIGVDFVQTSLVIGLRETGKDKYISITAQGQSKNKAESSKAKGECKVYVYNDDEGGDTKHKYTVYYNANGGTGAPANQTKTEGKDLTLSGDTPTRDEYVFMGWATSADSTSADYQPGDTYSKDDNITLYAVWKDQDGLYHIEYDGNGGTGAPQTQTKQKDVNINISSTTPTYSGYTFMGWATSQNSKTIEYVPGQVYSSNASIKLYAVWVKGDGYKIIYNANGGTDAPAAQVKEKGKSVSLSTDTPNYDDHIFVKWNTKADGTGTDYAPGATYNTDSDLTLYAIWRNANKYTVTYDANGGKGAPANQTKTEGKRLVLSEATPTWAGHVFMGWVDENGTGYGRGDYYELDADLNLKAKWKTDYNCYILTYNANGGTGAPDAQEISKMYGYGKISKQIPTYDGYEFCCWADNPDGSGNTYYPGGEIWPTGDKIIYAVWKHSHTLTVQNGKTSDGKTTDKLFSGTEVTVIANEPGENEEFSYWDVVSGDLNLTMSQMASETMTFTMPDSDVVIKAVYRDTSKKLYKVTVINGTANGFEEGTWYAGSQIEALADIEEHPDEVFDHWNINGINLLGYEEYCEGFDFVMPSNNVTLEAVFVEKDKYELDVVNGTIDATGKTNSKFTGGESVSITADEPSEEIKKKLIEDSGLPEGTEADVHFHEWKVVDGDLEITEAQRTSESITFAMPECYVKIEATYELTYDDGYNLYVVNGKISSGEYEGKTEGYYASGTKVSAACDTIEGMVFDYWEAEGVELTSEQEKSAEITITMPDEMVVLVANYKEAPENQYELSVIKGKITSGTYKNKTTGVYKSGDKVSVQSDTVSGEKFDHWEAEGITLTEAQRVSESFELTMPANNVQLTAVLIKATETPYIVDVRNGKIGDTQKSVDTFYKGTSVTVKADTMEGLTFESWCVLSGKLELTEVQKKSSVMTFTMPASDVVLTPVYEGGDTYSLHVVNGVIISGDYSGETDGEYEEGTKVSVTSDAKSGKIFDHWEASGITLTETQTKEETIEIVMPANDVTLEACYSTEPVPTYRVDVINGTLAGTGYTSDVFYPGEYVTVFADDKTGEGRQFTEWVVLYGDLELSDTQKKSETMTFKMPASDVVIAAEFSDANKYSLYVVKGEILTGDYAGGVYGEYSKGDMPFVGADVISGMAFDHWEAEGIELTELQRTSEILQIEMPANDVVLTAVYYKPVTAEPYKLTVINGYIETTNRSVGSYLQCTPVTTIANDRSKEGKVFDKWVVLEGDLVLTDEQAKSETLSFEMPWSDVTIEATYENTYSLTVIKGTITDDLYYGEVYGEYLAGDETGAKCDPISGYQFDHWEAEGITLTETQINSEEIDITMPANDVVLRAYYTNEKKVPHVLYVFNGDINLTGFVEETLYYGSSAVLTAMDLSQYGGTFTHWTVEKGNIKLTDEQAKSESITITMPDEDVTVMANYSFGENNYTLSVIDGEITTGTFKGTSYGIYKAGEKTTVTCDEESGRRFDHWNAEGITLTEEQRTADTFELTMPAQNVVLTAVYTTAPSFSYSVNVINGTLESNGLSEGRFYKGDTVTPVANERPTATATSEITELEKNLSGLVLTDKGDGKYTFKKWVVVEGDIKLTAKQETSKTFDFEMIEEDVVVAAAYEYVAQALPTGDTNSTLPWIIAIIVSMAAMAAGAYSLRKKGHRTH